MVRRSRAMVSHGWPVIRHSSEFLLVVVLGPELIRSSPLGIVMVSVIIISVSPVVSVTVVLLIRPLAGEIIWSVVPGASVGLATRPTIPVVVILVPVLLVLVMPFSTPDLVAVATIVKFPISLPVSSICVTEVSLVRVAVVIPLVPVHLLRVRGGQVEFLRMRVGRQVRLRHEGIPAGARRLWAE